MMLTLMQEPKATIVGGFNQWKAAGRYVRKGESGIGIWAPGKAKDAVDDQDIRFFMITVFDVSQTEKIEAEAEAA